MTSTSWQVIDGAAGITAGCLAVLLIAVIRHAGSWLARRAVVTWQVGSIRGNRDQQESAGGTMDASSKAEDSSLAVIR